MKHINDFNTHISEALGVNKDLEKQADEILKEISQSSETEFEFPFYHKSLKPHSNNHFFKLVIKDLGYRKFGHFHIDGKGVTITISDRNDKSSLLHELKHLDRHLYNRKEDILTYPLDTLYGIDDDYSMEKRIFYLYNTDEFEAKYHSYYVEIDKYIKNHIEGRKANRKLLGDLIDSYLSSCEDKSYQWWGEGDFRFSNHLSEEEVNSLFYLLTKKENDIIHGDFRDYFYNVTKIINGAKNILRKKFRIYSKSERIEMEKLKNKYEKEINRRKKIFHKKFRRIYTIMIEKWIK